MKVLEVENLVKEYLIPGQPAIRVLDGVTFSVDEGEHVAIMGRSGAGKTTLLNILGGLDRPTSGSVRCTKNAGFVFQSFRLMPELTVLENVILPSMAGVKGTFVPKSAEYARELLEKVGLSDRAGHLPAELSGGEQQRVAIARALVNNPAVLFADEPTGNLDSRTKEEIHKLLFGVRDTLGQTLVIVTHDPALAAICDRSLEMKDGQFV